MPLEQALARNAVRDGKVRVTDATLTHMAEVLQWPDPSRHPWEARVLVIPADAPADPFPWAELARLIAEAVPPLDSSEPQGEAAEAARGEAEVATASSVAHALDLRLRRAASLHLQAERTLQLPPVERAALARALSERKKQLLQRAKASGKDVAGELHEALADELDAAFTASFARAGAICAGIV